MKAWLKGGLIGAGIGIIYFLLVVITFLFASDPTETHGFSATMGLIAMVLMIPFSMFAYFPAGMSVATLFIKLFFPITLSFFILGCIVGAVIGKIKSRNKNGF